jgi:hypothetical protein
MKNALTFSVSFDSEEKITTSNAGLLSPCRPAEPRKGDDAGSREGVRAKAHHGFYRSIAGWQIPSVS